MLSIAAIYATELMLILFAFDDDNKQIKKRRQFGATESGAVRNALEVHDSCHPLTQDTANRVTRLFC